MPDLTCNKCKYHWVSLVEKPKVCPRCKRYDYAKEKEKKGENKNEQ